MLRVLAGLGQDLMAVINLYCCNEIVSYKVFHGK